MFSLLRNFFTNNPAEQAKQVAGPSPEPDPPPSEVIVAGAPAFPIAGHTTLHEGYPLVDWRAVQAWVDEQVPAQLQADAWSAVERAWLLHFKHAMGPRFELAESNNAAVLSSLEANVAGATLQYMERTLARLMKVLDGIAQTAPWGKDILIIFDDADSYYRYVSYYYPDAGEYAFSGGMHINQGCSHYVTVKADLHAIEAVIAHEMTHGCLGHLPLPEWLHEGLAVNTEHRLTGKLVSHFTPQQLRQKHLNFWGAEEIQEFWSGRSFLRTDDGNALSYDLARVIVEQTAMNWPAFKSFVLTANASDAGAAAAREHLGIDLGDFVCALLEKEPSPVWAPNAQAWRNAEEQGAAPV